MVEENKVNEYSLKSIYQTLRSSHSLMFLRPVRPTLTQPRTPPFAVGPPHWFPYPQHALIIHSPLITITALSNSNTFD
jgi:hypothetical protein